MIVPTGTRTRTPGVYVQLLDRRFMSNSYLDSNYSKVVVKKRKVKQAQLTRKYKQLVSAKERLSLICRNFRMIEFLRVQRQRF